MKLVDVQKLLEPYEPQQSAESILEALNIAYHAREASRYDSQHAEICQQLPPLWREMIAIALRQRRHQRWSILDFGCGTGFEVSQLLRHLPHDAIADLWCYDLSPEMLQRCRCRISPIFPETRFTSSLEDVLDSGTQFNLLITNSLLHHLPKYLDLPQSLAPRLSDDAIWLTGHEPSARFYKNSDCRETYDRFLREHRWRRRFSPSAYVGYAKRQLGMSRTPAQAAANQVWQNGLFKRRPPARLVSRLVDLHVAHSVEEVQSGRGFDVEQIQRDLAGTWELVWTRSYSFMGAFYEGRLSGRWRDECLRLSSKFPDDGANFSAVWQRSSVCAT